MQKGDIAGVVIVLVILGGLAAVFALAPKAPEVSYVPTEVTGSAVTVSKAEPGRVITVSADVKQPSFVTVHQAIGEAPGPLVGQSELLDPGLHSDLKIELDHDIDPTSGYFVLMFLDNGNGVYEPGVDLPIKSDGTVIKQKLPL